MTSMLRRSNMVAQAPSTTGELELESFLPYRLAVLSDTISRNLARAYAERFQLSVAEWRVMAVLGRYPGLSAAEVAERGAMDKVMVSRAVTALLRRGWIKRQQQSQDRRRSSLRLSRAGRAVYRQIVPLAKSYELALLAALAPVEVAVFDQAVQQLLHCAREIPLK